jgi:hypothetical protein
MHWQGLGLPSPLESKLYTTKGKACKKLWTPKEDLQQVFPLSWSVCRKERRERI